MNYRELINTITQNEINSNSVVAVRCILNEQEVEIKMRLSFNTNNAISISDDMITGNQVFGDQYLPGAPLKGSIPIKDIIDIQKIQ